MKGAKRVFYRVNYEKGAPTENTAEYVTDAALVEYYKSKNIPIPEGELERSRRTEEAQAQALPVISSRTSKQKTASIFKASPIPKNSRDIENFDSKEKKEWRAAEEREWNSHIQNGTWLVRDSRQMGEKRRPIQAKWVYSVKRDGTKKARMVARGFSQIPHLDFTETSAFRILASITAHYDWEWEHIDFTTAYLNAPLRHRLYMSLPAGFTPPTKYGANAVLELKRAIYGLKQAGFEWNVTLVKRLLEQGFTRSKLDPCIFWKREGESIILLGVYVDDVSASYNNREKYKIFVSDLEKKFKISKREEMKDFLSMEITRDRSKRTVDLKQTKYVDDLLERFGQENSKPASTPMDSLPADSNDPPISAPFRESIGGYRYLADNSRLDISMATSALGANCLHYQESDWTASKRVLRYLKGTNTLGIRLGGFCIKPNAFCDSSYSDHEETRESRGGWILRMGDGPIMRGTKRFKGVKLSTDDAEFTSLRAPLKAILSLRHLLVEIGFGDLVEEPTIIYEDNQAAVRMTENATSNRRSKHIDVIFMGIRDAIMNRIVTIKWVPTASMIADILTKPLGRKPFLRLLRYALGMEHWEPQLPEQN